METTRASKAKMEEELESTNTELGQNDSELADNRASKSDKEATLAEDQEFLATLTADCKQKTAEYEERKMTRAQEEASVSEAISVLSSDDAFDTFTTAGRTNAFIQLQSVTQNSIVTSLLATAKKTKSLQLARIAAKIKAGNPFEVIFAEVEKLIQAIKDEEEADDKKFAWCEEEQTTNEEKKADLSAKIANHQRG